MMDQFIGAVIAKAIEGDIAIREAEVAEDAMVASARALSVAVADNSPVTAEEAFDCLCTVPDNLLPLLQSPQGWTTLAGYIGADLAQPAPVAVVPTIH